jgi:hypothetical protein
MNGINRAFGFNLRQNPLFSGKPLIDLGIYTVGDLECWAAVILQRILIILQDRIMKAGAARED